MKTIPALVVLAISTVLCPAQDRLAETLRKGVIDEETRQDLNSAIRSYESVLAQFGRIPKPSAEDRKTAATALFRLAESYRNLGRTDAATQAYERVLRDFEDQGPLAVQSRARLARLAGAPDPAEARKEYRALLEQSVKNAEAYLKYSENQFNLGATSVRDMYGARPQLLERQRQLAAFDAGALPQPANMLAKNASAEERRLYRQRLVEQVELATKIYLARKTDFQIGKIDSAEMLPEEQKLIDAKLELAAFDATPQVPGGKR